MAEGKPQKKGYFRGKPRPDRRIELSFRYFQDGELGPEQRAFTKNIGVGGAFILVPAPPVHGTTMLVSIPMGEGRRPVDVRAEVRWGVTGKNGEPESEHGMGVRFTALDVDQLLTLNEYFATLPSTMDIG